MTLRNTTRWQLSSPTRNTASQGQVPVIPGTPSEEFPSLPTSVSARTNKNFGRFPSIPIGTPPATSWGKQLVVGSKSPVVRGLTTPQSQTPSSSKPSTPKQPDSARSNNETLEPLVLDPVDDLPLEQDVHTPTTRNSKPALKSPMLAALAISNFRVKGDRYSNLVASAIAGSHSNGNGLQSPVPQGSGDTNGTGSVVQSAKRPNAHQNATTGNPTPISSRLKSRMSSPVVPGSPIDVRPNGNANGGSNRHGNGRENGTHAPSSISAANTTATHATVTDSTFSTPAKSFAANLPVSTAELLLASRERPAPRTPAVFNRADKLSILGPLQFGEIDDATLREHIAKSKPASPSGLDAANGNGHGEEGTNGDYAAASTASSGRLARLSEGQNGAEEAGSMHSATTTTSTKFATPDRSSLSSIGSLDTLNITPVQSQPAKQTAEASTQYTPGLAVNASVSNASTVVTPARSSSAQQPSTASMQTQTTPFVSSSGPPSNNAVQGQQQSQQESSQIPSRTEHQSIAALLSEKSESNTAGQQKQGATVAVMLNSVAERVPVFSSATDGQLDIPVVTRQESKRKTGIHSSSTSPSTTATLSGGSELDAGHIPETKADSNGQDVLSASILAAATSLDGPQPVRGLNRTESKQSMDLAVLSITQGPDAPEKDIIQALYDRWDQAPLLQKLGVSAGVAASIWAALELKRKWDEKQRG